MILKFKEFIITETVNLQQAIELYGYKPGDIVDAGNLMKRFKGLMLQHHPDQGGNSEIAKNVNVGYGLLKDMIGKQIPNIQSRPQPAGQPTRSQTSSLHDPKKDIRDELNRAINSLNTQPMDSVAAVKRLLDPNHQNWQYLRPLLKTSLNQWLQYKEQGFNDYLLPILKQALTLV